MEISPPEKFSFEIENWGAWKQRFQRFRAASDLATKSEERQIAMLLYAMGERAEDIFTSFGLSDDDSKQYNVVLQNFDNHFIIKRNVIFERVKFNSRKQEADESSESFITALHKLAETCEFGNLRGELIRDRIVVGINNDRLSEKLQMDKDLTLEKTITLVRQNEQVRQQQCVLRGGQPQTTGEVNAIRSKPSKQQTKWPSRPPLTAHPTPRCRFCGRTPHSRNDCPARNVKCHICDKSGHFASVCRSASTKRVGAVSDTSDRVSDHDDNDDVFLGAVNSEHPSESPWMADICINDVACVSFKVDTGADVSVISVRDHAHLVKCELLPSDKTLRGPDNSRLTVTGRFTASLLYNNRRIETVIYVVDQATTPLLSRTASTQLGILARIDAVCTKQEVHSLYPQLFTGLGCMAGEYTIRLRQDAEPLAVYTPRRIPLCLLPHLKDELDKLQHSGVIKRVDEPTPWCAPIVVVPKAKGIRLCADLTRLNTAVLREQYTMPVIDQLLASLTGATVFSKLDCNSGFYQIPLSEDSMLLTTFTTPYGRYCYTRLPFGISSASEVYQKRMNDILQGLTGTLCLIDDVLIFGKDQAEHDARLHAVLRRLRDAHVTLNDKCEFSKLRIKYAGHVITGDGISPDPERVSAVHNMPPPSNVSDVRCFLGMVNQLAKFTNTLAEQSAPLRDLLRKGSEWTWDTVQRTAYDNVKKAIASAPVLALYDPRKPTMVSADSSSYGLGAVIKQQQPDGTWRPVAFASRALSDVERRYAQIEKECLALTWACERFSDYVIGKKFVLQTDHKPLTSLLSPLRALDDVPPRIQRMRIRLMRFDFVIEYLPGRLLYPADTLSRLPLPSQPLLISPSDIIEHYVTVVVESSNIRDRVLDSVKAATAADHALPLVMQYCQSTWPDISTLSPDVQQYAHSQDHLTVCNELLMYDARVVIPPSLRPRFLNALHAAHQGVTKSREKARQSIWWPKIGADIERHITACTTCAHWRTPATEPLIPSQLPDLPFEKVATDLFVLDNKHYLVLIDYYSRYIELTELRSETAADVISALQCIFARHGIPATVHSDNGPCFAADLFQQFAADYGFLHTTSSPRYAQANGEAERAVQTAKGLLRKASDPHLALLTYRTTPNHTGYSPAQLLMGRQLRSTLPITTSALKPAIPDNVTVAENDHAAKQRQERNFNSRHRVRSPQPWQRGEEVWVPDLHTRATVIQSLPFRTYELLTSSGSKVRRNGRALRAPLPFVAHHAAVVPRPRVPIASPQPRCRVKELPVAQQHLAPALPIATPPPPTATRSAATATRSGRQSKPPDRLTL